MTTTVLRPDIEGDFVRFSDEEGSHFGKRLPSDVAWYVILEPRDLEQASAGVVQSVVTNFSEGVHYIHYRSELQPLDLGGLRSLLRLDQPLATWRLTRVAIDLCEHLQTLHEEGVPQLLIHPERIGRLPNKLVLLPTLARSLPTLSQIPSNTVAGWIHFISAEALRTRALDKGLLFAADIYSLGRTLRAIGTPTWQATTSADALLLAEKRVEDIEADGLGEFPAGFRILGPLLERMLAALPGDRPQLTDVLSDLRIIEKRVSPEVVFDEYLRSGQIELATACLSDLMDTNQTGLFGDLTRTSHIMSADLALAQSPPDCSRAIVELDLAESPKHYEADIQHRMGRAYALFTTYPNHLEHSHKSYLRAARLSSWQPEVVDEWVDVLKRNYNPAWILETLDKIPSDARTKRAVMLRTECLLQSAGDLDAWMEVAQSFPRFAFDQELFDLARRVGWQVAQNPKYGYDNYLMKWMHQHRESPGFAGPVSIVWEINGNRDFAAKYLKDAERYAP
jgi:hypothetical protein